MNILFSSEQTDHSEPEAATQSASISSVFPPLLSSGLADDVTETSQHAAPTISCSHTVYIVTQLARYKLKPQYE